MSAMNKITDKLFLGNIKAASDLKQLKANNITHILQVAAGIKPFFPSDFQYKIINILDNQNQSILRHFPGAIAFIKNGIENGGGVLVHCYAGVSRSAACVIAFLMQEKNINFDDAFSFASKRRPIIFPNIGFQRQLIEFGKLLIVKQRYSVPRKLSKEILSQINVKYQSNIQNIPFEKIMNPLGLDKNKILKKEIDILSPLKSIQLLNEYNDQKVLILSQDKKKENRENKRRRLTEQSVIEEFEENKLDKLNEINKEQIQQVLKSYNLPKLKRINSNFQSQQPLKELQILNKLEMKKQFQNRQGLKDLDKFQSSEFKQIKTFKTKNLMINEPESPLNNINRHTQKVNRNFSFYNNFTSDKFQNEQQISEIDSRSLSKYKRKNNLQLPQLDQIQIELLLKDKNQRYKNQDKSELDNIEMQKIKKESRNKDSQLFQQQIIELKPYNQRKQSQIISKNDLGVKQMLTLQGNPQFILSKHESNQRFDRKKDISNFANQKLSKLDKNYF